jgi:antitoxin (DNA-binding transcriptional repressor) of toxin-antitoxin stability system
MEEALMKTVSIHDIETQLLSMLLEIEKKGERVVVYRDGVPIVDLIPHRRKSRLTPHPLISQISINYDPTEPLTADEWPEEE